LKFEFFEQDFLVGLGLGVAAQDGGSPVGGRKVDVEHLDGRELIENGTGGESGGMGTKTGPQGDVETVGQKGDKDVGFDPGVELVVDRAPDQIVFEGFERSFDFRELDVKYGLVKS
jgi:hypothetical protein